MSRTPNELTIEQEIIVRKFLDEIVPEEPLWNELSKTRGVVVNALYNLLGYASSAGGYIPKGDNLKWTYGQPIPTNEGLYEADGRALMEEYNASIKDISPNKTSTRKSSKSK